MRDFTYYTPTKVVFGHAAEAQVGALIKEQNAKKVLVHFGGHSAQKSGLLDKIYASLTEAAIPYLPLGGVVPNPRLSMVYQGIELCKKEGVDFILAVGGGSVIDSAKAIGYGLAGGEDVWKYYTREATPIGMTPVGAVLTIAAAGSEMSNSSVITNDAIGEKRGFNNEHGRCCFAVMNPEWTLTLSAYQTAVGCADIMMHTMERYFTKEDTMQLTDEIAEALMRTVMQKARYLTRYPDNYNARAEIMWAGSLSHNGLTGAGGDGGDWATHQLGHSLSARFDLAHGASLTAVWGSWARTVYTQALDRFVRFATHVMELPEEKTPEATALAGIEEMEGFFWAIEMPTSLSEAGIEATDELIEQLADNCSYHDTRAIGSLVKIGKKEMIEIYQKAKGE